MKDFSIADFVIGLILVLLGALIGSRADAYTVSGYLVKEYTTGMTRQCVYDVLGSTYIITVSAVEICPLTIKVEQ